MIVVAIMQRGGTSWYTNVDADSQEEAVTMVKGMIDRDEIIPVWWFASWGQRYAEKIWVPADEVAFIRTEQDDG